jgi:hypothetical protein
MFDHCDFRLLALAAAPLCLFGLGEPVEAQSFGVTQASGDLQQLNGTAPLFGTGMVSVDTDSQTLIQLTRFSPLGSLETDSSRSAASRSGSIEISPRIPVPGMASANPEGPAPVVSNPVATQPDSIRTLSAKWDGIINPTQNNLFIQVTSNSPTTATSEGAQALWNADNTLYKLDQVGACAVNRQSTAIRTCR